MCTTLLTSLGSRTASFWPSFCVCSRVGSRVGFMEAAISNDAGGGSLKISQVIRGRLNRMSPDNMGIKGHGEPSKLKAAVFPSGRNAAVEALPVARAICGMLGMAPEWRSGRSISPKTCHPCLSASVRSVAWRTLPILWQLSLASFSFSSTHSSLAGSQRKSGGCGIKLIPRMEVTVFSTGALPGVGPGTVTFSMGAHSAFVLVPTRLKRSLYVTLTPPCHTWLSTYSYLLSVGASVRVLGEKHV